MVGSICGCKFQHHVIIWLELTTITACGWVCMTQGGHDEVNCGKTRHKKHQPQFVTSTA